MFDKELKAKNGLFGNGKSILIMVIKVLKLLSILFISSALVGVYMQLSDFSILENNTKTKHVRQSDGAFVEYYQNGKISSEEFYKDGFRYGNWRFYYEDGALKKELNYKNGLLEGIQRYFSINSKLIYTEVFVDGKLEVRNIKNDSLYNYEVNLIRNGQVFFENECENCHLGKNDKIIVPYYVAKFSEDTLSVDSAFAAYFNDIHGDSIGMSLVDSVNTYDILAVIRYIDKQYQTANRRPNDAVRLRKIRLNKKSPQL